MDAAMASVIAAAISAVASVAVAVITTRARITAPKAEKPTPQSIEPNSAGNPPIGKIPPAKEPSPPTRKSTQKNRIIAWILVGFLYFMSAIFLALFGAFLAFKSPTESLNGILAGWGCLIGAVLFTVIGRWAQRRLARAAVRILPQSAKANAEISN